MPRKKASKKKTNVEKKTVAETKTVSAKANETKVELETLTLLGFSRTTAYLALLFLVTNTDYDINQNKIQLQSLS